MKFALLLWSLAWPLTSQSHESIGSVSNALVLVRGATVNYYLSVPPTLGSLLFDFSETAWYRDYFSATLKLRNQDAQCPLAAMSEFSRQDSGNSIVHLTFQCSSPVEGLTLNSEVFLDLDDRHVQLVKLVAPDDPRYVLSEGMLSIKQRALHIDSVRVGVSLLAQRVWRFFRLGVEHILTGYDHILFLLAVILVSTRFLDTLKMITSFTVAHSITLALAFSGVISLPASVVEPLIALTIVYVAFENLYFRQFQWRWILTFMFGLIHGLGFVGVLKEITISRHELLTALISFNVGIEAGQLLIVTPIVVLIYVSRDRLWWPAFIRWSSIGMGLLGLIWFVDRVPLARLLAT